MSNFIDREISKAAALNEQIAELQAWMDRQPDQLDPAIYDALEKYLQGVQGCLDTGTAFLGVAKALQKVEQEIEQGAGP